MLRTKHLSRTAPSAIALLILCAAPVANAVVDAIPEIIVTAEKRESTVQDTPLSIAAFSGDQLASIGVNATDSLANYTPGLTVQKEVIGKVVIRGIGTENFTVSSDPGVAIHQDGAYLARSSVAIFDFFDVDRIEVLRGPQGTLYGRNATGGVINIISKRPTDEFGGYAKVDVGDYAKFRAEGALNAPLADNVRLRVSGLYAQRDGYTKNLFGGSAPDELDTQDLTAGRLQLGIDIADGAELLLQAEALRDDSLPPAFKYFEGVPWFSAFPGNKNLPDLRQVSQGFETDVTGTGRTVPSLGRADQDALSARLTWDFDNFRLSSLTAWREVDFSWVNDGDGVDQFRVVYFQTDNSRQFTQEFQLSNTDDGPLKWVAGFYYLDESSETFEGIPLPLFTTSIVWDGTADTKAYALYGQGTYSFTDRLRGTFGLRYNAEEKKGTLSQTFFAPTCTQTPVSSDCAAPGDAPLNDDWQNLSPKLGVDYDFTDDVTGYANVTRGFKSGGINLLFAQRTYDEEKVWSYDVGVKSRLADGRIVANIGAFYYDYTDLQVGKVVNTSARVENAADATIYGAEAEVQAIVGAGFEVNAGLAYLNTEFDKFLTEDPAYTDNGLADDAKACGTDLTPGNGSNVIDLAGCELARAPELQGNLGVQWSGEVPGGEVKVRADYAWRDDQFFTQFNRPNVSQDSYGLLGARISYGNDMDSFGWSVTVYGDNLTDEDYFVTVLESGVAPAGTVVPQAVVGAPRTIGVIGNFRF